MAATETVVDTREMVAVHSAFRREIRQAPALISSVPDGDRTRAGVVRDHLQMLLDMLHRHHAGEDELLWPKLLDRVPADLAPTVELMEHQHEAIHAGLQQVLSLVERWSAEARADDRDRLVEAVQRLQVLLLEHLDAEEQRLLPIAGRSLTPAEWNELSDDGMGGIPKRKLAMTFGMIMKDADPQVTRQILSRSPAPVRVLLPRLAPHAYARYARKVYGSVDHAGR